MLCYELRFYRFGVLIWSVCVKARTADAAIHAVTRDVGGYGQLCWSHVSSKVVTRIF